MFSKLSDYKNSYLYYITPYIKLQGFLSKKCKKILVYSIFLKLMIEKLTIIIAHAYIIILSKHNIFSILYSINHFLLYTNVRIQNTGIIKCYDLKSDFELENLIMPCKFNLFSNNFLLKIHIPKIHDIMEIRERGWIG